MRFGSFKTWVRALVAGVFLVGASAQAATIPLGTVTGNTTFSNTVTGTGTQFTDQFTFTINSAATVGAAATSISFSIGQATLGQIFGFQGDIDGIALGLNVTTTPIPNSPFSIVTQVLAGFANLGNGPHTLTIRGTVAAGQTASYGGNLSVAAVPVPPAVWLMGSALLALAGIRRRTA